MTMVVDGHTGDRAHHPGRRDLRRRHPALAADRASATRRPCRGLRRPDGRELLVPEDRRVGEAALPTSSRAHRSIRARAGGRPRPRTSSTTSSRRRRHALADAGVLVQLGAHGQREGLAAHWEIWMLVQGGMTPHRGAPRRHHRRRRVPRHGPRPRVARGRQARRPRRPRRQSARGHPALGEGALRWSTGASTTPPP